jgi:hypothetical protein
MKKQMIAAMIMSITSSYRVQALNNLPLPKRNAAASFHSYTNSNVNANVFSKQLKSRMTYTTSTKLFAARSKKTVKLTYADILTKEDGIMHPRSLSDGTIPSPKALSPSAAAEFKACPQSYLFQYLYGIRQPTNTALAKGSVCHSALEQLYDLQPSQRTLPNLHNLFRKNWSSERMSNDYKDLFDRQDEISGGVSRDMDAERQWGNEALSILENYFQLEDPRLIPSPNPIEREIWVNAKLAFDPSLGSTGSHPKPMTEDDPEDRFLVRGIVDRLDFVAIPPSPRDAFNRHNGDESESSMQSCVRIVDYKTGKAPDFKYSPATNERIASENMWQLKIYALLLREMIANGKNRSRSGNLKNINAQDLRLLRLLYLTSKEGEARWLDLDLGETEQERDEALQEVHVELVEIWESILALVAEQDPRSFVHCDRKFCFCHKIRPKFEHGSLYQHEHL